MAEQKLTNKKYKGYHKQGRHGVLCRINNTKGSYPLHRHDYIEIEYLTTGKLDHELNGFKSILTLGDCWCLDNRDLHMFTVLEPVEIHNICIDLKTAPEIVQTFLSTFHFPMIGNIKKELLPTIDDLFAKLSDAVENEQLYAKERITSYLLLLLTQIFENCEPASSKPASSSYEHVARAIDFISQNYAQPITLTDTANAINVSPNHLSKLFPEVSGNTFLDYLTNIRIKKAKELLAYTETPVTYVAFDCGFGSFSTFSRIFKKQNGCTPSDYRDRKKGEFLVEEI